MLDEHTHNLLYNPLCRVAKTACKHDMQTCNLPNMVEGLGFCR